MHSKVVAQSKPDNRESFNWLQVLLAGVALPLFVVLGFWQLDRADQKESRLEQYAQTPRVLADAGLADRLLSNQELVPVSTNLKVPTSSYYLLDNRTRSGVVGYEVVVPVQVGEGLMLANLGWVKADVDRRVLPAINLPQNEVAGVDAVLSLPDNLLQLSSESEIQSSWPRRVQTIEPQAMGLELGVKLSPVIMRLYTQVADEITPHKPTINSMPPERHLGYAVQWFALAGATLIWLLVTAKLFRRDR